MVVQHHVQVCRFLLRVFEERGGEFNRMLHCDAIGHIQSGTWPCSSIIIHLILTNVDPTSSFLHDPWWLDAKRISPIYSWVFRSALDLVFNWVVLVKEGVPLLFCGMIANMLHLIFLCQTHMVSKMCQWRHQLGWVGQICRKWQHVTWRVVGDDPKKSRLKKADIQLMVD